MNRFGSYIGELQRVLANLPLDAIEQSMQTLHRARMEDRQVFVAGNGGSASTASHMACDLGKNTVMPGRPRFRVMALTDNTATLTALSNDLGYENVFAEQLAHFVQSGDVLVAISASGNSENILRAVKLAKTAGATTIGFSGYQGGKLAELADIPVVIESDCIEQIEDVHLILEHMLTVALRDAVQAEAEPAAVAPLNVAAAVGA